MSMRPELTDAADVPFTLVCRDCDAGMCIESQDQAVAEGWAEIDYAPDLPMANFVGLCPDCQEAFEHWSVADRSDG
jgi:hypothetical protein